MKKQIFLEIKKVFKWLTLSAQLWYT